MAINTVSTAGCGRSGGATTKLLPDKAARERDREKTDMPLAIIFDAGWTGRREQGQRDPEVCTCSVIVVVVVVSLVFLPSSGSCTSVQIP